jgi:hypothetical protein
MQCQTMTPERHVARKLGQLGTTIIDAWQQLAQTGAASRYGGRAPDGRHEILLLQPQTGQLLASGRGETVALAICAAVREMPV